MKKLKVFWTDVAENDLKGIIAYIALDNPVQALKKLNEIKKKAGGLYAFPEKGRVVPELKGYGILNYRELIVPPWRIIYQTTAKTVYVMSVLDSRRNIEDLLLGRLTRQII
jgi:plasmid stabilization system protein ParE